MPEYNTKVIKYNGVAEVKKYVAPIKYLTDEQKLKRKRFREDLKSKPWLDDELAFNPFTEEYEKAFSSSEFFDTPDFILEREKTRSLNSSFNRTKQAIYRIVRANVWEYFITLTFNRDKVVASDYDEVRRHINSFLTYARHLAPDLKYIFIPEFHKDGVNYHIHGLVADIGNLQLIDSGVVQNDKNIYNLSQYKKGFSTVSKIVDINKTRSYITKYITKELCSATKGKRRYWASKNLIKPDVELYNFNNDEVLTFVDSLGVVEYAKTLDVEYSDLLTNERHHFNKCKIFNVETE